MQVDGAAPDVERFVMETWREVLDVAQVEATSDFFGLGGDSLGAMRIAAAVLARFDLPPGTEEHLLLDLLDRPTPRAFAGHVHRLLAR